MLEFRHHYIDGCWRLALGEEIILRNPATEEPSAIVGLGTAKDVDEAVSVAKAAQPCWSRVPMVERAALLSRAGECLAREAERIAAALVSEIGTPIAQVRRLHVEPALHLLRNASSSVHARPSVTSIGSTAITRVPIGVAALITPWNYPLYLAASKVVPALLAGSAVILKPSELAPGSIVALAGALHDAGLPPGVLNVVFGEGTEVGEALVRHSDVDVVSFTGSTAVGRRIGQLAGGSLKKMTLELGGKSASVLLQDAPLKDAIDATLRKCFQNSGQTCAALSRLLVPNNLFEDACEVASLRASAFRVGDPLEHSTDLGPLISSRQRERSVELLRVAMMQGARCVTGGGRMPDHLKRGYFMAPTVLATTDPTIDIAQTETFAPILTVLPYRDETDAISIANGTPYGLSAAVWAADEGRAIEVAQLLRAGSLSINGAMTHPDAPFGGFRASGFGRERGPYAVDEFMTTQALHR
jgi:aldehyde dehydrogenase (NAD+)